MQFRQNFVVYYVIQTNIFSLRENFFMKILYFAFSSCSLSGVEKKIIDQTRSLRKMDVNVELYMLMNEQPRKSLLRYVDNVDFIKCIWPVEHISNRLKRRAFKLSKAREIITRFPKIDTIVYFRYPIADKLFLEFLKYVKNYFIITEHQEKEATYQYLVSLSIRYFAELLYGRRVRSLIDGFVSVTPEILEYEMRNTPDVAHKLYITIGNGINVKGTHLRQVPKIEDCIKVLYVGSAYKSHGIDRFLKGMKIWKESNGFPVKLSIAGDSSYLYYYKRITKRLKLINKVEFLGHQSGRKLDELFNNHHIALGNLGDHRKGLSYTSELKAREYCARGIPFIMAAEDKDFPSDFPFILKVPQGESYVDIKEVIKFTYNTINARKTSIQMRQYAIDTLDWIIKAKKMKSFFENLLIKKNHIT